MLSFVPTPIGNLGDITFRSLEVLKESEIILCEDTRVTKKLLSLVSKKYNISFHNKIFQTVHSHNERDFLNNTNLEILKSKNIVYLSDAGMPCISDPGAKIVKFCIQNNIKYDILPGASAVLTAFAMSGFDKKEFIFYGFLPHKEKNRLKELRKLISKEYVAIIYESPHRLLKLLENISQIDNTREIFLVKELTKLYQKSFFGNIVDILHQLSNEKIKGEWVVIIDTAIAQKGEIITIDDINDLDIPPKQKAKLISKLTGVNIKKIYNNYISSTNAT